jgi:hypothetical protein
VAPLCYSGLWGTGGQRSITPLCGSRSSSGERARRARTPKAAAKAVASAKRIRTVRTPATVAVATPGP